MTDRIPFLSFDSAQLPPGSAYAAWSKLTSSYDAELIEGDRPEDFNMRADAWMLGSITLTSGHLSPIRLVRTPFHIAADKRDNYNFLLLKTGEWRGEFGADSIDVGSGEISVFDFARAWTAECTANEHCMIVVPRREIEKLCPNAPPLHGRLLGSTSGRMLAEHMLALPRFLPSLDAGEVPMVEAATLNLVAAAINSLPRADEATDELLRNSGTLRNVRLYIDRNLTNPDLSVDMICRTLGISRPSLYRRLSPVGGVAAYMQRRRLEAAHALIADEGDGRGIAEIAQLYCFASQAHFSTAFRRCFGYSPREARGTDAFERAANGRFHNWTRWLAQAAPH